MCVKVARCGQERPGAVRSSQEQHSQEQPQEEPGAARSGQEQPGEARSSQEQAAIAVAAGAINSSSSRSGNDSGSKQEQK